MKHESLKSARKRRNLTQKQLAEKLEISRVTLARWETGKSEPHPLFLRKWQEALQ